MNYRQIAEEIRKSLGGSENIKRLSHCMTRLRIELNDEDIVDDENVRSIEGVLGVVRANGQYQIIIGSKVKKCYEALQNDSNEDDIEIKKEDKENLKFSFKGFCSLFSQGISPSIQLLIGGGTLAVLGFLLLYLGIIDEGTYLYDYFQFVPKVIIGIIPILFAYSLSKHWKVNQVFAIAVAVVLVCSYELFPVHSLLDNTIIKYAGTFFPIMITVFGMKFIEASCKKYLPTFLENLFQPMIIIGVCSLFAIFIAGPIGYYVERIIYMIVNWLNLNLHIITMVILTVSLPMLIKKGMHWLLAPIFIVTSTTHPDSLILPAMLVSNVAQGAASLAVSFSAKDSNMRKTARKFGLQAALVGVTEPAMYGVNVKKGYPFKISMVTCVVGGALAAILNIEAYAFTVPSILMLPQFMDGIQIHNFINASVVMITSFAISFIGTYMYGIKEERKAENIEKLRNDENLAIENDENIIYSPISGKIVSLEKVPDQIFSSRMMGDGIAIVPNEGKVYAPFDGTVMSVFPTKHAIAMVGDNGVELLIHVGINTVELEGKYFDMHVESGEKVKQGQLLSEFNIEGIEKEGYPIVTPIIITNTSEDHYLKYTEDESVSSGDICIKLHKNL